MTKRSKKPDNVIASGKLIFSIVGAAATPIMNIRVGPQFLAASGTLSVLGAAKLANLSDLYQYYRFRKLSVRNLGVLPSVTLASGNFDANVVGYEPDNTVGLPTSFDDVMGLPFVGEVLNSNRDDGEYQPTCTKHTPIPPNLLLDQNVRWWRTRVDATVDDQFEFQGVLSCARFTAGAQVNQMIEVDYTCEFKDFTTGVITPLKQRIAALEEEKAAETCEFKKPAVGRSSDYILVHQDTLSSAPSDNARPTRASRQNVI